MMNVNFRTSNLKLISNADKICYVTPGFKQAS